jgi:acyl-coenzyme A thioesterase PaaI-like protein
MAFVKTGCHAVEAHYEVAEHFCGAPQVVHGGIQATMLDEVLGFACRTAFADDDVDGLQIVTAEFSLRYRIPVPTGVQLLLRGEVERTEGRNIFVKGAILDDAERELTRGEARWVRLA